jgi:hypothetical protein
VTEQQWFNLVGTIGLAVLAHWFPAPVIAFLLASIASGVGR